jgi:hypothetical protein
MLQIQVVSSPSGDNLTIIQLYYLSGQRADPAPEVMEAQLPDDNGVRFEEFVRDEYDIDMDERGYSEVTSRPNPDEILPSIGEDVLNHLASSLHEVKYADSADQPVAIKKEWQKAMEHGINVCMHQTSIISKH